jgi:hypothetical protein
LRRGRGPVEWEREMGEDYEVVNIMNMYEMYVLYVKHMYYIHV